VAVFRCPDGFSIPSLEALPGTRLFTGDGAHPELAGTEQRVLLKLHPSDLSRLHALLNTIVLPACRLHIPLYVYAPWDLDILKPVSIPLPERAHIDRALEPLWREQMRTLLAAMCVVFPLPEAMAAGQWHTPVERYLAAGFAQAGIPCARHSRVGPQVVDFLLTAPDGRRIAVETDGRGFHHEPHTVRDAGLTAHGGVAAVIRFSGLQVLHDRAACIERIKACMASMEPACGSSLPPPLPGLSPEQASCLTPRAGAVLTLAPAGSGKTRVLTRRVVEAVRDGILPERVLCVVFNRAASLVMAERIHQAAGLPGVRICTLHSLGYEICRNAPESPYAGFQVVTPQTLPGGLYRLYRQAIRQDLADLSRAHGQLAPRFFPEHLVAAYEEAVSRSKRTLIPAGAGPKEAGVEGFDADQCRRVQRLVEDALRQGRLITYDDQICRAAEVLMAVPEARRHYQGLFDAVLVDEVQDLTPAQFLLVRLLALPQNNLFAVGDDDQMINTFTGADPANIRSFQTWFPGAAVRTLGENHRCAPDIVVRSAHVISYNRQRFSKPIRPAEKPGQVRRPAVHVLRCPSLEAETTAAVHTIKRWTADGYTYRDIAVLVRVRSIASPVQMGLTEHGIPFQPLEEALLYTSPVGLAIGAYLDICRHPETAAPESYARALAVPPRYLSNDHLRAVAAGGWPALQRPEAFPPYVRPALADFLAGVGRMHQQYNASGTTAAAFLDDLLDRFGIAAYFLRQERTSRHPVASTSSDIIDMIRQMADACPGVAHFVDGYAQRMAAEQAVPQPPAGHDGNRVTVTTIHRSKGDEYRGVVLFHAAEHTLPHRRMLASREGLEEERRVFYVAMTRAVERLCITTEKKRASRFLKELDRPAGGQPRLAGIVRETSPLWRLIRTIRDWARK
jgi:DNA helicase-2/ATP-dependent DNA helicase PcrA